MTVAEYFNKHKEMTNEQVEVRKLAIRTELRTENKANLDELQTELAALNEVIQNNIEKRGAANMNNQSFTPIAGATTQSVELPTDVEAIIKTPEYRNAFFKTLQNKPLTDIEQRAYKAIMEQRAAFGNQSSLAAVLPTQTYDQVITKARGLRGLVTASRNFNIPAKLSVPVASPSSAAAWHVEGAPVTAVDPNVLSVMFNAYELIKIFSISASSSSMAIGAFEAYLTGELANCLLDAMEAAVAVGTGIDQGAGLSSITFTAANSKTFVTGPGFKDYTAVAGMLKGGYSAGASWAMNNATLYNQAYSIVDSNGRPIFVQNAAIEGAPAFLLGKPVIISDSIADDVIYFGNFQYMGYNLTNVLIEMSRESSFKSNLIDYKVTATADCKPIASEAFVKLYKA